ncbi:PEGA domain-containing protein [Sedimenticola sp.]|uniref:PEGA domain-containing protein n=1 Tax=Sedimenticola sp. TaxID=1940285 RepID=UPI003D0AD87C
MKRPILPVLLAGALTSACTAHTMFYADPSRFTVTSTPAGATVYVMGQVLGTTPLEIRRDQVFPATYPSQLEAEYGYVTLRYQDCEPYRQSITNKILENDLKVTLACGNNTLPAAIPLPTLKTAPKPATPPSIRHRLLELKQLYSDGLISEQEYSERRKAILNEL